MYPGSFKNYIVQLTYKHGGSKVNNEAKAALLAQVGGKYDPIDDEFVGHYVEDAGTDIYDGVWFDLWELLEKEEALSKTLVVLAEHKVGHSDQQVPQGYVHQHLRWVEGTLKRFDTHYQQGKLLGQHDKKDHGRQDTVFVPNENISNACLI